MDWAEFPDFSSGDKPSPRRELQIQGPRPTPLRVRKDSHKIKKPPIAPPYQQQQQQQPYHQQQQQQQQRQPVIIYTISPKVIHTDASEFMSLVQRLTGPNSSTSSLSPQSQSNNSGAVSPAARFATIEKTKMTPEGDKSRFFDSMDTIIGDIEIGPNVERTGSFPGILSPLPSSLPVISPGFFSPPSDQTQNSFNFLHDLSPMFQGKQNYFDAGGAFMPSPGSAFLTAPITSPNLSFDLFNQFLDF